MITSFKVQARIYYVCSVTFLLQAPYEILASRSMTGNLHRDSGIFVVKGGSARDAGRERFGIDGLQASPSQRNRPSGEPHAAFGAIGLRADRYVAPSMVGGAGISRLAAMITAALSRASTSAGCIDL